MVVVAVGKEDEKEGVVGVIGLSTLLLLLLLSKCEISVGVVMNTRPVYSHLTQIAKVSADVSGSVTRVKSLASVCFHSVFRAAVKKSEVVRRRASWTKKVRLGVPTRILMGSDVMLMAGEKRSVKTG